MVLKILNSKFELLLAICIALLPWSINLNSIFLIVLIVVVLMDLIFVKKQIKLLSLGKGILIAIPFLVFLLGLFWTTNLDDGFKDITATISFVILPLIFYHVYTYYTVNFRIIFVFFISSCLLKYFIFFISLLDFDPEALLNILYWKTLLFRFNNLMNEQSIHPTYFSLFLGISIFLCYYLILVSKKKGTKYIWIFIISVSFCMLISIMAKMPIISLFISFGVIGLIRLVKAFTKKKLLIYIAGLLVLSFLAVFYIKNIPNTFVQDFSNYKNLLLGKEITDSYNYSKYGNASELKSWQKTNRFFLWQTGLQVWKKNLFFGTGTGDYKTELNKQYTLNGYTYMATASMNTHNQYLSYLVQYGIIGFLIIICCFWKIFKHAYSNDQYVFIGIYILLLFSFMTENVLDRQWGIVCFAFFTSLFLLKPKGANLSDKSMFKQPTSY